MFYVHLLEVKPKGSFSDCFQTLQKQGFVLDFKADSRMDTVDLPALLTQQSQLVIKITDIVQK